MYVDNQGIDAYLVFETDREEELDPISLGMLVNNNIPGLCKVIYTCINDRFQIKYHIASKIPVSDLFGNVVGKKHLFGLFRGVIKAVLAAEEYMIDPAMLQLEKEYMYWDPAQGEAVLVCLPLLGREIDPGRYWNFFKQTMVQTRFDPMENCDYVGKILTFLNHGQEFSLQDFGRLLQEIDGQSQSGAGSGEGRMVSGGIPAWTGPAQGGGMAMDRPSLANEPAAMPYRSIPHPAPSQAGPSYPAPPPMQAGGRGGFGQPPAPMGMSNPPMGMPNPPMGRGMQPPGMMSVPPQSAPLPSVGKKMGLMELLTHYNRENLQAYKQQKAEEKHRKTVAKQRKNDRMPPSPSVIPPTGFAIPGQPKLMAGPAPGMPLGREAQPPYPGSAGGPPGGYGPGAGRFPQPMGRPPAPVGAGGFPPQAGSGLSVQPPPVYSKPANFGETTFLSTPDEGTTLLAPEQPSPGGRLLRVRTGEEIRLTKAHFCIGKDGSKADYCIGENPTISRSHLVVVERLGAYYAVDQNSKNFSYLNNSRLQAGQEAILRHGDKLRLSNEEFTFLL